jgi:hypothetical protein
LFTIDSYVADPAVRRRSWLNRCDHATWSAVPNAGHRALVDLETAGRPARLSSRTSTACTSAPAATPPASSRCMGRSLDGSEGWIWDDAGLDVFEDILDRVDAAVVAMDAGMMSAAFHALVSLGETRGRRIQAQPTGDDEEQSSTSQTVYPRDFRERVNVIVDRLCRLSDDGPDDKTADTVDPAGTQ